jgi:hypothetical protein
MTLARATNQRGTLGPMRHGLSFVLLISMMPACAFLAKSPALASPLHERLAKADEPRIEQAVKGCLIHEGWTPDDLGGFAEGATVVSAKNAANSTVSVYIQPPEMSPRVTGGPEYDDPFWGCLARALGAPPPPAEKEATTDK